MLTDGAVDNIQECKDLAQTFSTSSRIFSFGIGSGASTDLIHSLARITGGMSEIVLSDQDQLSAKVMNVMDAATMADTSQVRFHWMYNSGDLLMAAPERISLDAFQGRAMAQYAIFRRNGSSLVGAARLLGNITGHFIDYHENFSIQHDTFSASSDPIPLHYLAAKARLVDLTDRYHATKNQTVKDLLKKEAEKLSVESGVVCSFTAMVAVDPSGHVVQGDPIHVSIPRGTTLNISESADFQSGGRAVTIQPPRPPTGGPACLGPNGCGFFGNVFALYAVTPVNYSRISTLQSVDGSWSLSQDLIDSIGAANIQTRREAIAVVQNILLQSLPTNHQVTSINRKTVATIVAVAYFRNANLVQGRVIERKAVDYLTQLNGFDDAIVQAALNKAMELVHFY